MMKHLWMKIMVDSALLQNFLMELMHILLLLIYQQTLLVMEIFLVIRDLHFHI